MSQGFLPREASLFLGGLSSKDSHCTLLSLDFRIKVVIKYFFLIVLLTLNVENYFLHHGGSWPRYEGLSGSHAKSTFVLVLLFSHEHTRVESLERNILTPEKKLE